MSTAILFNGAASYIAQEAGILDLLLGNVDGVPGLLNIPDVEFVGGLSSGALMSFAFNAAFCESPKLTWDEFKQTILFTLKSENIYTGQNTLLTDYDTSPLRGLLTGISEKVGYKLIKDLPFDSAILIRYENNFNPSLEKTYWLTNIPEVANKLPSPTKEISISTNIQAHQLELELVSSLMCSTAIPTIFPRQNLLYNNNSTINKPSGEAAFFLDGGVGGDMVFFAYQEFFNTYGKHFDKIYIISPDYATTEAELLQRISLLKQGRSEIQNSSIEDVLLGMHNLTKSFLKDIKTYNSGGSLATTIYYCTPEVKPKVGEYFDFLNFSNEKEQYGATITWGKNNPNNIAIDINTLNLE